MNRSSRGLLGASLLIGILVLVTGCAKDADLHVVSEVTYIGPQVADSISVHLTDSLGWDYKVNMNCTFTNVGGPGRVNVLATVAQGDKSWERHALFQTKVGQPMTATFEFPEPKFDWVGILAPLVSVYLGDWGRVASAFLRGQSESGIRGSCQVYPYAADMKMRLDCIVSNVGEGNRTVTVKGYRNGIGKTSKTAIGPGEQETVPFLFQVESEDDSFDCQVD